MYLVLGDVHINNMMNIGHSVSELELLVSLRECQVSLADEERKKKEKIQFLAPRGSGSRRSFSKVFARIPVEDRP